MLDVAGVTLTLLILFFGYNAWQNTKLQSLSLPDEKRPYRAYKDTQKEIQREAAKEKEKEKAKKAILGGRWSQHRKTDAPASQIKLNEEEGVRAAFYVPWDAASFSSLKEYSKQIDLLYPEWLHVLTPDGHLQGVTAENKLFDVYAGGTARPVDEQVMPFLKASGAEMEVFPLVNNFDPIRNDWVDIGPFLSDQGAREGFRKQIEQWLATDKYRGLMVDFESFATSSQPGYVALLEELAGDLHQHGQKLYVSVPSRNDDFDYKDVAGRVDGMVVMNYDQHYPGGEAGPIAAQDWFTDNLRNTLALVPKEKIICAIGSYGYDWPQRQTKRGKPLPLPADERDSSATLQEAWLAAKDADEKITFDPGSLNSHFSYLDDKNWRHDVWFLDAVTALNQMRAAESLGITTFALWRLGSEDRSLWKVWDVPGDASAPDKLKVVPPGQDVDMEGQGEILHIQQQPSPGARTITYDAKSMLITGQDMVSTPLPYRVGRYGASPNQIALTFDDGPDPKYTAQVLDILKAKQVKATFFLIGVQAEKYAELAQRVKNEGHLIGNHTFTHPDISEISKTQMKLELNLTELLFAARLGIKPLMFRPPYSVDQEPDTEDQVGPLELVQSLGYVTVGNKIDPNDWRERPHRSGEEIAAEVLSHLPPCSQYDLQCGNIILLHDGGGNREETVRALPLIIDGIRAKGLTLVPVTTLMGKTEADVMPPIPASDIWPARLLRIAFWLADAILLIVVFTFFAGDVLMTSRLLFVGFCAVFDRFREKMTKQPMGLPPFDPHVAVLVPAYNEEKVIERTVRSVLDSDYANLRVIVIDDGSKDHTLAVVQERFAAEIASGKVTVLTKPNAGKAEALNFALQYVTEEIFVGIDADTIIAREAIGRLVPHFRNGKIGAMAGNAKVGNRVNLWTRWQALEYITSQNFERRALDLFGVVCVVPGAIGAWRTAAVRAAGGYHPDTVAEDADLTMTLLQNGYRVYYEDRALAYTEAPTNANGLMRQRFRWSFGILQAVWKHRGAMRKPGPFGWFALPNIWIFQIVLPLFSPAIDIMFFGSLIWYGVQRVYHPESFDPTSFLKILLYFLTFLVIDFVASTIAFLLERRDVGMPEDPWLLSQVWLQRFAYRQLFSIVLVKTIRRAIEGKPFVWDKLERTAAVTAPARFS